MAASSVVELEPGRKRSSAFRVRGIGPPVRPLGLQGAVEAFDFPVLPGAVRTDELLPNPVLSADPAQGVPVRPRVIGDQSFDPSDPMLREVHDRAFQEFGASDTLLIGKHGSAEGLVDPGFHS